MPTQSQRRMESLARTLTDPGTFATPLVTILLDEFGTEALQWRPETIALEITEAFGIAMPQANFDRLMAGIVIVSTDRFYKDLPTFIALSNCLSGATVAPGIWDPADAAECAWGITEALLLGPPEDGDDEPFVPEICGYIGHVLDDEGILDPPDVLKIAERGQGHAAARTRASSVLSANPRISAAVRQIQEAKTGELEEIVRDGLRRLVDQMTGLRLGNGDAAGLLDKLSPPRKG
jgi:hypothetical protein